MCRLVHVRSGPFGRNRIVDHQNERSHPTSAIHVRCGTSSSCARLDATGRTVRQSEERDTAQFGLSEEVRSNSKVRERDWSISYANRLLITDAIVIAWAVFGSQIAWFGLNESSLSIDGRFNYLTLSYTAISLSLTIAWLVAISIYGTRDSRVLGSGTTEYKRVINASLMLFGLLAIIAFLSKAELARGYFVTALPVGLLALLASRWLWRQFLTNRRLRGEMSSKVLLVGSTESVEYFARELARQPQAGYQVVGACIPTGVVAGYLHGTNIPVMGNVDKLLEALSATGADTVIVTSSDGLSSDKMRRLSWSLEPGRNHLVVTTGLVDIAGPRIHTRPVAGLPLIHVETPRYEGYRRSVKRAFDIVASAILLVLLSAPLAVIAIAVRLGSGSQVLFRQDRTGLNGRIFRMLKFRSMVSDAEALLIDLHASQGDEGNRVMFKMAEDPRVTAVGKFLRRFSLDELPQLFNVLVGDMSLVGPRPPLPREVEQYEHHVNRRFLVKPGITGLWQVSGRSNLDWEETVRLDLYYVENWSLTGDLVILWRTLRAVLARDGAF
jgi:exopolysaccharide biosynthesis polyprenyl glycosylphosphotransferase